MLSIIVPSYNRKAEVPTLLESLTQQTSTHFEVIIVDDCSKEKVVVEQRYSFPVTVIRNETNQGAAESRNIGVHQMEIGCCFSMMMIGLCRKNVKKYYKLLSKIRTLILFIIQLSVKWSMKGLLM